MDVAIVEAKDDPPVAVDRHRPESPEVAAQRMKPVTGQTHLFGRRDLVEALDNALYLGDHVGANARAIPTLIETLESPIRKTGDHGDNVA